MFILMLSAAEDPEDLNELPGAQSSTSQGTLHVSRIDGIIDRWFEGIGWCRVGTYEVRPTYVMLEWDVKSHNRLLFALTRDE